MASRLWTVVVDAHDPATLARFWAAVLDWTIFYEAPDEVVISKDDKTFPGLVFVPVPETKTVKNRLHIDLNPDTDRDAEIERLVGLGARVINIGQGEVMDRARRSRRQRVLRASRPRRRRLNTPSAGVRAPVRQ